METVYGSCPNILAIAKRRTRPQCAHCKITFSSPSQLRAHNKIQHLSGTASKDSSQSVKKRSACELCLAPYTSVADYLHHLQEHFHKNRVICPVCGRKIETSRLPAHLDHHEDAWFTTKGAATQSTYRGVLDLSQIQGRLAGPEDGHCLACQLGFPLTEQKSSLLPHACQKRPRPSREDQAREKMGLKDGEKAFPELGF